MLSPFLDKSYEDQCKVILTSEIIEIIRICGSNPQIPNSKLVVQEIYDIAAKNQDIKEFIRVNISEFDQSLGISYCGEMRQQYYKLRQLIFNEKNATYSKIIYENLFDFQNYYEQLKPLTIPSEIIKISLEDSLDLINGKMNNQFLKNQVDIAIEKLGGKVFFKMRRSPKDAFKTVRELIQYDWESKWNIKNNEEASKYYMRIQTFDQLQILCQSSDRIREDIIDAQNNNQDDLFLIIREFQELDGYFEFRCFICNNQLNAVTIQPNQPELTKNQQEMFRKFFNNKDYVFSEIDYSHAVIDVVVNLDMEFLIIEINPFGKMAQSGKFSWVIDKDILYYRFQKTNEVNVRF
eukprot:403346478